MSGHHATGRSGRRCFVRRSVIALLAGIVFVNLPALQADASQLDEARRAGRVGEQVNGYLGAIDPKAEALVREINDRRRAEYAKIAVKNGLPIDQVAALAGEKLVRSALRNGYYVKGADGRWRKK